MTSRWAMIGAEIVRQIHKDLAMLALREQIDDPVHGLGGVVGVQRGDAQMAGAGQRHRGLHRLPVTDLADQHHVRRLTHRALQRSVVGQGVEPQFALVDDRLLVDMEELDRLLDGEDMVGAVLVAMIDHRRQRRGFAGAGSAHHQHQTAFGHRQAFQYRRQIQLRELGHVQGDVAQHHGDVAALVEHIGAEAAETGLRNSEIELQIPVQQIGLRAGHDAARPRRGPDPRSAIPCRET